jgi:hypothetical protein
MIKMYIGFHANYISYFKEILNFCKFFVDISLSHFLNIHPVGAGILSRTEKKRRMDREPW